MVGATGTAGTTDGRDRGGDGGGGRGKSPGAAFRPFPFSALTFPHAFVSWRCPAVASQTHNWAWPCSILMKGRVDRGTGAGPPSPSRHRDRNPPTADNISIRDGKRWNKAKSDPRQRGRPSAFVPFPPPTPSRISPAADNSRIGFPFSPLIYRVKSRPTSLKSPAGCIYT